MFDRFADTLSAVNQVAAFMGALACWGLGGWLVGSAVYWRLHAVRVSGEVIGVRQKGNCYNSVYRYLAPSGETCEQEQRRQAPQGGALRRLTGAVLRQGSQVLHTNDR